MRCIAVRILWLILLASSGGVVSADDTELYVAGGAAANSARPQVMIIFDTSGSMSTQESIAQVPFDPSYDYTGYGGQRLYYVRGGGNSYPDPTDGDNNYFAWTQNGCADALKPHPENNAYSLLAYEGFYSGNLRAFEYGQKQSNGSYWRKLPKNLKSNERFDYLIDCKADLDNANAANAAEHPNGQLRGSGFAQNSNQTTPYDGTAITASEAERQTAAAAMLTNSKFGQDDTVTLFTENYLSYYHSVGNIKQSRLQIAKDTITSLINSTAGVDFGLTVFNFEDGGRVVSGIKTSTDSSKSGLIETVKQLGASGYTPLCETLFEVSRYFTGGAVHQGRAEPSRIPLYDEAIIHNGQYRSPLLPCQPQSYVVLITDGAPTRDNSFDDLMKSELGLTDADKVDGNLLAGVADALYRNDLSTELQGHQRVVTYTIGFSDGASSAGALLSETALRGGGEYYQAESSMALQGALQQIFSQILAVNASFISPAIAVNSFDRTRTLDAVYYSMFLPSDRPRWLGNIKKLKINSDSAIVDSRNEMAINIEGNIADSACTIWTSTSVCALATSGGDGNDVHVGGVLEALQQQQTRQFFTSPVANEGELVPLNRTNLTAAWGTEAALMDAIGTTSSDELTRYIDWLQGMDVDDEDEDGSRTDRRFDLLGDPLHFKPLSINYGAAQGVRLIVATNAGYVHMLEDLGERVVERWSWYLPEMVDRLAELRTNAQTGGHSIYGVDGPGTLYIEDQNGDGDIDANDDRVWLFFGLRRGGRSYHGLDITEPDRPKLLWRIDNNHPLFGELGQTWAQPTVTRVPGHGDKPVVIVAAGYDLNKDNLAATSNDAMGRGIFILDAKSGALLHRFGPDLVASSQQTPMAVADSMPAQVAVLDSDGDGVSDRLYATDTGGHIWRVDMASATSADWSVFQFAHLGGSGLADNRRFYHGVSVAQTSFELREEYVLEQPDGSEQTFLSNSEIPFDAIAIGSGNRAHPNALGTQDHLFLLQDRHVVSQHFNASSNIPPPPLTLADLYPVGDDPFSQANSSEQQLAAELALGAKRGWYYPLQANEKSLSAPVIIAGSVFYTGFLPGETGDQNQCVAAGSGMLYQLNLQQGSMQQTAYLGAVLPDTPQIVVPPAPSPIPEDWDPVLYLIGVGSGDNRTGSMATEQTLVPHRVYYHQGQ